jgi:hypothetical protein
MLSSDSCWKGSITGGGWTWVRKDGWWELRSSNGTVILDDGSSCGEYSARILHNSANARLIAQAGTVFNQTGMTPRELAVLAGVLLDQSEETP